MAREKTVEMIGKRYGRLTVLSIEPWAPGKPARAVCRCDCGNLTTPRSGNVKNGSTTSCGCYSRETSRQLGLRNGVTCDSIIGNKFGRLTVLAIDHRLSSGDAMMRCRCDCGNMTVTRANGLKNGHTRSCGCSHSKVLFDRNFKHGDSGARLHRIWAGMRTRCSNPNTKDYPRYGGRGIRVSDEWNDFTSFRDWALSHGYADNLTIDRIDVDGDYSPGNCAWITNAENIARSNRDGAARRK